MNSMSAGLAPAVSRQDTRLRQVAALEGKRASTVGAVGDALEGAATSQIPVVSDVASGLLGVKDLAQGDMLGAAMSALAALPIIPRIKSMGVRAAKNTSDGVAEAAKTYGDHFPKYTAFATHESVPGAGTGHLPGLIDAPYAERQAFDKSSLWSDEHGRDVLYDAAGLHQRSVNDATGYFTPKADAPAPKPEIPAAEHEKVVGASFRNAIDPATGKHATGIIHPDARQRALDLGVPQDESLTGYGEPGFVTNRGRFLSRTEAQDLAKNANKYAQERHKDGKWLSSEMLAPGQLARDGERSLADQKAAILGKPAATPEINPAHASRPLVMPYKDAHGPTVSPGDESTLGKVEGLRAYLDAQNMGAWHKTFPDAAGAKSGVMNSARIPMQRALTEGEMKHLSVVADKHGFGLSDTGDGVTLMNFGGGPADGKALKKALKGELGQEIEKIVPGAGAHRVRLAAGSVDFQNEFAAANANKGLGTAKLLSLFDDGSSTAPAIAGKLSDSPAVRAKAASNAARDESVAGQYGGVRPDMQTARKIFAAEGLPGLRRALKAGVALPAIVGLMVGKGLRGEGGE